jgi:hypothetical protein
MNEERTGKCLWQVEHIRGHSWHRYSITVNQVKRKYHSPNIYFQDQINGLHVELCFIYKIFIAVIKFSESFQ